MKYPVKGRITSKFGARPHPVTKEPDFHNGIDIAVSLNTQVIAPANGKVVNIYENAQGGKQLILEHSDGIRTGYAHLSSYNVVRGQNIKAGQIVALTGNTGQSTGPHLHLTVTVKGKKVDPEKYFS